MDVVVDDLPEHAARAGLATNMIRESVEGSSTGAIFFTGSHCPQQRLSIYFSICYGDRGIPWSRLDLLLDYIWTGKEVPRKLSSQIKPISYLKAHASEIVRTLGEQGEPLVITQNGEAKVVVQDIDSFERTQETMALLKILALGNRQIESDRVEAAADVIARLRERQRDR